MDVIDQKELKNDATISIEWGKVAYIEYIVERGIDAKIRAK